MQQPPDASVAKSGEPLCLFCGREMLTWEDAKKMIPGRYELRCPHCAQLLTVWIS